MTARSLMQGRCTHTWIAALSARRTVRPVGHVYPLQSHPEKRSHKDERSGWTLAPHPVVAKLEAPDAEAVGAGLHLEAPHDPARAAQLQVRLHLGVPEGAHLRAVAIRARSALSREWQLPRCTYNGCIGPRCFTGRWRDTVAAKLRQPLICSSSNHMSPKSRALTCCAVTLVAGPSQLNGGPMQ